MSQPALTLVVATQNPHKVDEIAAIFAAHNLRGVTLQTLRDRGLTSLPEPDETGATFEANATIKALAYARATGALCLADDSGLEVDALSGKPGVISSHYATDGRETGASRAQRDEANNARLLNELASVPVALRAARFRCVMVLADGRAAGGTANEPRVLHVAAGAFEGAIGIPPRVPAGVNGFGYDPLFLVAPEFTTTAAELATDRKNAISHRARAAAGLAAFLREHANRI
jgi:XTP/dITP diphosphohydrolase